MSAVTSPRKPRTRRTAAKPGNVPRARRVAHPIIGRLVEVAGGRMIVSFDVAGITALAGAQMMFEILCLAAEAFAKRNKK